MSNRYKVGQRIRTQDGKTGLIRYLGELEGKAGNFVGIELEEALGKNDGSVEGRYYFECEPEHGIFYKTISNLTILAEPSAPSRPETSAPSRPTSLVSNGEDARRQSTQRIMSSAKPPVAPAGPAKRVSAIAPVAGRAPRPSVGGAGLARKPSATIASGPAATPPPRPGVAATRRLSQAPVMAPHSRPVSGSARPSLGGSRISSPTKPGTSSRLSTIGSKTASVTDTTRNLRSPPGRPAPPSHTSTLQSSQEDEVSLTAFDQPPTIDEVVTPSPQETAPPPTAASRTAGLAEKKRLLETQQADKRRADDSQKAKELEEARQRSEQVEKVNEKLQAKCRTQMEEIKKLRVALQEQESLYEQLEKTSAEHDTFMEDAILDKEMAEEREASARFDYENLRGSHDGAVEELARMKQHYEELQKDMTPEERANQGWLHMERENDRLKEALLLLRDRTIDLEADLQLQIQELETDNEELSLFRTENDENKVKLLEAQSIIEDLREQLETAEGAESMIEQLADRNTLMTERIEHLTLTITDLQNLKELADEIEESYVEQVKELEDLVDARDLLIANFSARTVQQKNELDDREYTITRFRDLVLEMQSSLEEMQDSRDLTEKQAADLESHHRSVMDFNRQLQASATSHKLKTIDLELGRMEAEQAIEQLKIIQLFLPDVFMAERNSVLVLLRFKRIAFKARLLQGMVKEGVAAAPKALHGGLGSGRGEKVLLACEALDKLVWIAAMGDRFESVISRCELEEFAAFEGTLYELEPVERTLNGFVEAIRSDSLVESVMVEGLARSIAVIDHLAELHLTSGATVFADDILMKTKIMHGQLENSAIALASTKRDLTPPDPQLPSNEEEEETLATGINTKMDGILNQTRAAKTITAKILKQLQDLTTRSMTLDPRTQPTLTTSTSLTQAFTENILTLSRLSQFTTTEEPDSTHILETLRSFNTKCFPSSQTPETPWDPLSSSLQKLHSSLSTFYTTTLDLSLTVEIYPKDPPWIQRSRLMKATKLTDVNAQEEVAQLKREAVDRAKIAREIEDQLEVLKLQTEVQEAKARGSAKRVARTEELERLLDKAEDSLTQHQRQVQDLLSQNKKVEGERDSWMRKAGPDSAQADGLPATALKGLNPAAVKNLLNGEAAHHLITTSTQVTALNAEVEILHSTTRYLRSQLRRQRVLEDSHRNSFLSQPLVSHPTSSTQIHPPKEDLRKDALAALKRLTDLPGTVRPVVLQPLVEKNGSGKTQKDSRLGWRPVRITPGWQVCEIEKGWREVFASKNRIADKEDAGGRKLPGHGSRFDGRQYDFLKNRLGNGNGAVKVL